MAAYYVGFSEGQFTARVERGWFPPGTRDGNRVLSYRQDLDASLDQQKIELDSSAKGKFARALEERGVQ